MLIRINPDKINPGDISRIVDTLASGGVIIYPTDSVYALGCDIQNQKAIERICKLKGIKPEKSNFSFICSDLSHLADYCKPIPNSLFRIMKKALPGPYTFILEASQQVPKMLKQNKKTVGIRVPDNSIPVEIIRQLGRPLLSTSLHNVEDDMVEYFSDPDLIYEKYHHEVDIIVDGGFGNIYATTVLDCSSGEIQVIREGLGELDILQ